MTLEEPRVLPLKGLGQTLPLKREGKRMSEEEFRKGYVYGLYPGLCGYAYHAEIISVEKGRQVMEDLLSQTKWIEDWEHGYPILHLKDGRHLFVNDTSDYPAPTDECDNGE